MLVHVDTDLGGDPDDACALAMLLGWPGVEVVGVTTNLDVGGSRAGCVSQLLQLARRDEVPVVAGAEASSTTGEQFEATSNDARYWPTRPPSTPAEPGAARDLLASNVERGATVIAIGAFTNLVAIGAAPVVAMAGWIADPAAGLPDWGPAGDWNVQCDTVAAATVAACAALTLVTLPVAMNVTLRERDLPRLRAAGPVGALLARQSETYAADRNMCALAAEHRGLPDDLVNFHWDPLTAAVAVGWPGVDIEELRLATRVVDGVLEFYESDDGRPTRVVVNADADRFREDWMSSIERVSRV
jgi:inosine-uridine nucleoside N-ribohydrolase